MAKAAKAPAKKTSPVVWVGLVALCAAVYLMIGGDNSAPVATRKRPKKSSTQDMGVLVKADYDAQAHPFPAVGFAAIDAFKPGITGKTRPIAVVVPPVSGAGGIDPRYTGGEANWYYTGCPELNGQKQALLENTATSESVYVRPGDAFKDSRVGSIDVSTIVLVGKDGKSISVPIQAYGDVPGGKSIVATNAPLPLPAGTLTGAIGGRLGNIGVQPATGPSSITLNDGTTLQLPSTNGSGTDTNSNGRRRARRNRNQNNLGDPNNGF